MGEAFRGAVANGRLRHVQQLAQVLQNSKQDVIEPQIAIIEMHLVYLLCRSNELYKG